MKTILALVVVGLTGCASVSYDPIEYNRYVEIAVTADLSKPLCKSFAVVPVVNHLYVTTALAKKHAENKGLKLESEIAKELHVMTIEMKGRYDSGVAVSSQYCHEKLTNIETAANRASIAIGGKR